ncbi:methionine synthase [Aciditerrimonas ferrireducens]|nr:methionine synthase [Aciditerrimonas ferrireducens]MCK4178139.1 methionine synthase [Aciditerrimonas ferrireducens]
MDPEVAADDPAPGPSAGTRERAAVAIDQLPVDSRGAAYLDAARSRVVVFDGAMGTNLQLAGLGPEDFGGPALEGCNEALVLSRPDVVAGIHRAFLAVGCEVVETNAFGANRLVLAEYGLADRVEAINRTAAELARSEADRAATEDGRPRWVAGNLGPGTRFPTLGQVSYAELADVYEEQARALLAGGVDLLLVETVFDLLQAKAAITGCKRAMVALGRRVPLQVQVTIELTGRMLPGTEIGAALTTLVPLRPDVLGLNCATGPAEMWEAVRHLGAHCPVPIAVQPNAGLPEVRDGAMHYDLTPDQLADHLARFVTEAGVSVVGGCCGTTPAHLAAVVARCRDLDPASRHPVLEPAVASIYSAVTLHQDTSFLIVGERTNANGSKRFREAMLAGDWQTVVTMAKEQVREGAHVLDVCVDYTGADGPADMAEVASRLATEASLPIMVDTTEAQVAKVALERLGGRSLLNSVNLEDGDAPGGRLDRFLTLAREHGAAVVCTCIDQDGQGRTVEHKLKAARAIVELAVDRYGLAPEDLLVDPLVLPLTTGMEESRRDGLATVEAIRRIKEELPGVHTIVGLSNVSFGIAPAARHVLNSVYLHELVEAGLDAAIVHAGRIMPLHRIEEDVRALCLDLIYDRRRDGYDPLAALIARFEGVRAHSGPVEDRRDWPVEQRLAQRIVDGDRNGLEDDLEEALAAGHDALGIVNDILLDGMKTVGDLFASGELQLPFVLQSAETMKAAVAYLEPKMPKSQQGGKGTVVLATVKGDVHDIGKNLVDIILSNNGYRVVNLGIKVGLPEMLQAVDEHRADALGMSGLLVKSTLVMRENLEELNRLGRHELPVLLGGAALTRSYVERDLREVYKGRVFYGKDAFEGLRTMDQLMALRRGELDDPEFGRRPGGRVLPARRSQQPVEEGPVPTRSPEVDPDVEVPTPPFLGTRVAKGIPLDDVAAYLNKTALFRNQWGYRPLAGEDDATFKERVSAVLREQLDLAKAKDLLVPQVAWGYFPVHADGDDLVVYEDDDRRVERVRFHFPRQRKAPWLCIADFFTPVGSGRPDYACFQLVTVGPRVSEETARLFAENRYTDYLLLHGLGVEMAEALAEYWHRRVREEWGFADQDGPTLTGLFRQQYRGGRYSFGYPACPELADNEKAWALLDAGRIGVSVSEGFQLHPEQSTVALVCHHPQAKYFVA